MIEVYSWPTPNCHKVHIMLEETGLAHDTVPVNIITGAQFEPDFLKISPNNKVPAIVDRDGPGGAPLALSDSGAILLYLAEKTGRLMPVAGAARYAVLQWLMFQMAHVGPMFGQAHHFRMAAKEEVPYGIERYTRETRRLWGVLDRRLEGREYLAGDYSIADIAVFPWTARYEWQGVALDEFRNVARWYRGIEQRPAVARGMEDAFA